MDSMMETLKALQGQMETLNKRRKSTSAPPPHPSCPTALPVQLPSAPPPPPSMPPPSSATAIVLSSQALNSLNACVGCGKQPQSWEDCRAYNLDYWPRTSSDNDVWTWCQSLGSRLSLPDADKMSRNLMKRAWAPSHQTGWLVVMKSSRSAAHKWVSIGCKDCDGCQSFSLNGCVNVDNFDSWLGNICGQPIDGVRH